MDMHHLFKGLFPKTVLTAESFPKHIAIIMDGNGRWAQKRGLPRTAGHQAGMDRIREAISTCIEYGISHLTLYAFSTENWSRPQEEVSFIMKLFHQAFQMELENMHQLGIKIRFIGLKDNIDATLLAIMEKSEEKTLNNRKLVLNIALNYGGRAELVSVVKGIGRAVRRGELDPDKITETDIESRLFTYGQPTPDLLIRPGGESRISNFLIWQMAYTELYFAKKCWPEFGKDDLIEAFNYYSQRERRYGGLKRGETVS